VITGQTIWQRTISAAIFLLAALTGVVALLYPFFRPVLPAVESAGASATRSTEAPLLTALLLVLCLSILLIELQGQMISAKIVAALGVMVALTASLRVIEVAIPGPGGFTPIFAVIVLAGYVFGARFGFLLGALTLLVSALLTGGVGPWLPFQMFAAGWIGLTSGWLPHPRRPQVTLAMLIVFGAVWGFLYGLIINLYSWPFIAGDAAMSWQPGIGLEGFLARYGVYYLTTSLIWDIGGAAGNVLLLLILGVPGLHALTRFRDRFQFQVQSS
jgi:energy-coupling factor transport system substrate-specific component